jgi:hypothetical protein
MHKLFKPFSQALDHDENNPYGNGLGLHICKLICNCLEGDIECQSDPNILTQFSFWTKVKMIQAEFDFETIETSRVAEQSEPLEVNTKQKIAMRTLLQQNIQPDKTGSERNLRILCADDTYYSLEALEITFRNLGLLEYCMFFNNGKEVVEWCVKNMHENPKINE